MHDPVIETAALSRRFGDRLVVDNLHLEVPAGAVYGFLGPNGAGKTTTIRMLLGLLKPSGGNITLFGRSSDERSRIGALVEAPSLYPHLTGEENLRHACSLKSVPKKDISRVLSIVGLENDGHRPVKTYSLGMKQRLGLAQAMLGGPELVILDEPTNGLDPAGIQEMRHLLRDMPVTHGITVFLSSHLLGEVEQIASLIGIIAAGRCQFQGTPEQLRARRKGWLRIGVDGAHIAVQMLSHQGYEVSHDPAGFLVLPAADHTTAASINRLLVERGFAVHAISHEQPTLEEMFLDLMQSL